MWRPCRFVCIRVQFDPPPIPIRTCDWAAWDDDNPEAGMAHGATREEAAANLFDLLEVE